MNLFRDRSPRMICREDTEPTPIRKAWLQGVKVWSLRGDTRRYAAAVFVFGLWPLRATAKNGSIQAEADCTLRKMMKSCRKLLG